MASIETIQMLAAHPDWIAPRSDVRVFLGEPGGPEASKTTVEPGNSFSPGMGTYGITWWLRLPATETFFAPELAPLADLHWSFDEGCLPILTCTTACEPLTVTHRIFQDGTADANDEAVCGEITVAHTGEDQVAAQLFMVVRSLGPAGWPIPALSLTDTRDAMLDAVNRIVLKADRVPTAAGCGVGDPSAEARRGAVPAAQQSQDPAGWCYGVLCFDVPLRPHDTWSLRFECPIHLNGTLADELPVRTTPAPAHFSDRAAKHRERWRAMLGPTQLEVPDADFVRAFYAGLHHLLTAMVGTQVHIAPLAYPLPWLRDGVIIIRCLELAGLHELARQATEWCAQHDFFGGFGPEGDAPGQGIWALVEHYRFTHDAAWLAEMYPAIRRKVDWLMRMRRATAPIRAEMLMAPLAFMQREGAGGIICLAARDGLIQGVMDHGVGHALGWINHWALCGLREAAYAAHTLGEAADAAAWAAEAASLHAALRAQALAHPDFFDQERTVNSLLWPTGAWADAVPVARQSLQAWWERERGLGDDFRPEPYWLYFEFAQAHNALLLGMPQIAQQVVAYRLAHQDLPGLYGWREGGDGVGMENAVQGISLLPHLRGCQRFASVTPHGWSQAEFWLLQRALLVEEQDDGLLLLAGAPAHWLECGQQIRLRHFPTAYGNLILEARGEETELTVSIAGIHAGTHVHIHPVGCAVQTFVVAAAEITIRLPRTA